MHNSLKVSGRYSYYEKGEGAPLIILHGLMGGLSNFDGVAGHFSTAGYKVIIPELPLYDLPLLKTNVKQFAIYLRDFIMHLGEEKVILIGIVCQKTVNAWCNILFQTRTTFFKSPQSQSPADIIIIIRMHG